MAANKYLKNVSGVPTEVVATQVSAGVANANQIVALNAQGLLDTSVMPVGIGADTASVTASEAIAAGAFVNVWSNAGAFAIRNADNTVAGKEAHGFVLSAVASAAVGNVYFAGNNNAVTGQTPGNVYLGTVGGSVVVGSLPTAAGSVQQIIGEATSATSINFTRGIAVVLA